MPRQYAKNAAVAAVLLVAMLCQETLALAGTTGSMSGTVSQSQTSAPIAGAQVTASSPSQIATTTTDGAGHFTFLTLTPDTYTVSVSKDDYQAASVPGQSVFADATQVVAVRLTPLLKTIVTTRSVGATSLVRSGTTADVYSISAANHDTVAALGGGGGLNSAYSSIATVPGAFVPLNQAGYYQTVHIRGGDYDQVGYEFDGVPVNRSFDNYPSSGASSLGNSEVQVYTGATPANSEGQGLAGYINQVIKTGTFPGTGNGALGIGAPTFYNKATVEAGGATPDRLFSYYIGLGGFNQDFRYIDQSNGTAYQNLGVPLFPLAPPNGCKGPGADSYIACYSSGLLGTGGGLAGPGGWFTAPINYPIQSSLASRDVVANVHFGIAHKHDGGRDDVQLLWNSSVLLNGFYSSPNDGATPAQYEDPTLNAFGAASPTLTDSYQWTCGNLVGTALSHEQLGAASGCVKPYLFPSSSNQRYPGAALNPGTRDAIWNNQEILKAQYQKNFGSNAYLRVYGYTYYSDYLQNAPGYTWQAEDLLGLATDVSPDYELSSHTRGASATFSKQFSSQHLLSIQASYTTATSTRSNNTQMLNTGGIRSRAFVAVDSTHPLSGMCYTVPENAAGAPVAGTATETTCNPNSGFDSATFTTWATVGKGAAPDIGVATCGGGPCSFLLAENSQWATFNTVKPIFTAYSITDQWRPSERWLVNLGLRLDDMQFDGADTDTGPARDFWFAAYNRDTCVNTVTGVPFDKVAQLNGTPSDECASFDTKSATYRAANLINTPSQIENYHVLQPRVGLTYTMSPNTVLRASYGRYAEAPNSAYQQYNTLEDDLPFALLGPNLYQYGRNTPGAAIGPPTSNNYDLSLEQRLKGTDVSVKLTPFYRHTQDQIQNFFLNQATGFVSGLNVGAQTSRGFELAVQKGDFSRNGFSGLLSFAYTYSTIRYGALGNGTTIISPINATIAGYNAYTSACAPGGSAVGKVRYGQSVCGATSTGVAAAPCYAPLTAAGPGTPVSCSSAGAVANPYYNAPVQSLIDPEQPFPTYDIFPAGIGSSVTAFGAPYVATLVLNYKHDRWAVAPSLQFNGGTRYGAPESSPGIDPAAGCNALPGTTRYDATSCLSSGLVIPNPYTRQFDPLGSFVQPNQMLANLQLSYDVSPKVSLVATLTNLVNTCWGGTAEPWTAGSGHNICSYGIGTIDTVPPVGNVYNPDSTIQQVVKYPYLANPGYGTINPNSSSGLKTPFQMFLEARIKL